MAKTERFIQTCVREWAYAEAYPSSDQRTQALHAWLHHYNCHRSHAALHSNLPVNRLGLDGNNLLTLHLSSWDPAARCTCNAPSTHEEQPEEAHRNVSAKREDGFDYRPYSRDERNSRGSLMGYKPLHDVHLFQRVEA
jgi:hypothetical protein